MQVSLNGSNVAIPVDIQYQNLTDQEALPIRRADGKIEEITAHNSVAVVDVNLLLSAPIDVSKYRQVSLRVITTLDNATHDANPTVSLHSSTDKAIINGVGTAASKNLSYGTYGINGSWIILTSADIAALSGIPQSLKIGIKANVAPTSGNITVVLQGVPN